ncbi:MAG: phosphomannomutase/phosphoglucomutase [Clostridia bacterium]|nr:phosphomannomutase/phosphoglucomutase [Clostridia bacterium]
MKLKELQNGSDIRGIATGADANLTPSEAEVLGAAFALWLRARTGKTDMRIALGRDSRVSGPALLDACAAGLQDMGADVLDCGMASTPAMFMATVYDETDADGAIMVTASHLPMNRNGLKFFTRSGGLEKEDIQAIIDLAEGGTLKPADRHGTRTETNLIDLYTADLVRQVRSATGSETPLAGLHIIVDAGNGAGGFYAEKVLAPLGADVSGSQFLDPDGTFPNHIPNPENADAMASIVGAVKNAQADFGIIFDTDVDRAGAVDADGTVLNRNRLIALLAAILLEENPGTTIVTDSVTSDGLADFIAGRGGRHHRFKRGYRNVINESIRLNNAGEDSALAIETSGHAAFRDNYFLDDGAYLITRLLIQLARQHAGGGTLSDLIADLAEPAESTEIRLDITDLDYRAYGEQIIHDLETAAVASEGVQVAPDNYEGVRLAFDDTHGSGWLLLRLSLHEPLMPVNIESTRPGGVRQMAQFLANFLRKYDKLDQAPLVDFLSSAQH